MPKKLCPVAKYKSFCGATRKEINPEYIAWNKAENKRLREEKSALKKQRAAIKKAKKLEIKAKREEAKAKKAEEKAALLKVKSEAVEDAPADRN